MNFTKEEKKQIDAAYENVLYDLKALYQISELDYYRKRVKLHDEKIYKFEVNQYGVWFYQAQAPSGNCIASFKTNGKIKIYRIPYELIFGFLNQYDGIREGLEEEAKHNLEIKQQGMDKISELEKTYSKEAVIEVEMPNTLNHTSIEVYEEDGKNVGRLNIGPISLKILTSPNVKIINPKPKEKVKQK